MTSQTAKFCNLLEELARLSNLLGHNYRAAAYRRAKVAIAITKKSIEDWNTLPGVGKSISAKIEEFRKTGKLAKVMKLQNRPLIKSIERLQKIKGIGPRTAKELAKKGIHTKTALLKEVRNGAVRLTSTQRTCLTHYADLTKRIPLKEADRFKTCFVKAAKKVDPNVECSLLGSYRRLKSKRSKLGTVGDLDVLLFQRKTVKTLDDVMNSSILRDFANQTKSIVHWMKVISEGKYKIWALVRLERDSRVRHLDIRLFPAESYVTGMLHFTGSKTHNQMLRLQAIKLGMHLSEYELRDEKTNKRILLKTERDVYRRLRLSYISPGKR